MRHPLRAAAAALLLAAACAHIEPPSGGPEDETPPALLVSRPDSLEVRADWSGPVVLVFDERVSERNLETAVTVSPRTSAVRVDHRGDQIRVSLERGWRPNTVYHVTLGVGVQDLFDNRRTEPLRFVFSTGAPIPDTRLTGTVVDPITGKPEVETRVEAILARDSLVYSVSTDSAGEFLFSRIPEGEYRLRAFRDLNRNRALDPFEVRDTGRATLAAGDSVRAEFAVLALDSTAATITAARLQDGTLQLEFDDYLDPEQEFVPAQVQILSPTGSFVPVNTVSFAAPAGAAPAGAAPAGAAPAAGAAGAAADTARADSAGAARPLPSRTLVLELSDPAQLEPGTEYRISVARVRNLVGLIADAQTTFTAPERQPEAAAPPPPPADTASTFSLHSRP